jgi:hypothetical protein
MNQVLSLWRLPLDKIALVEAETLRDRQPQCLIQFDTPFNPMTVYNFGFYAMVPGGGTAPVNTGYLSTMFSNMASANPIGGLAFIPQSEFEIDATDAGITVPDQCNVVGSGPGGVSPNPPPPSFYHFIIMTDGIFLNCSGISYTSGGQYFRSLAFQWSNPALKTDTCIMAGTWNCRAIDCNFVDCPTAFWAAGLQCGLITPTISYAESATVPHDVVAVYLQGGQSFVLGPGEFRQKTSFGAGGPDNCSAIALGGGSANPPTEHALITEMHIFYWSYAIDYKRNDGVFGTQVTNVEADIYRICVRMQPFDSSGIIFGEKFTSCLFRKSNNSTDGQAIILIDTNGGDTDNINDIEFLNCTVFSDTSTPQADQYCYQITSGSNIRIIGGTASGAGLSTGHSAGIAITPPFSGTAKPGRITVLGVDLGSQYPLADNAATVSQQYAVLISATLSDVVTIDSCQMSGYESIGNPVSITGDVGQYLYIRNCPGYNDQNTLLNGNEAPTTLPLSASMCSPTPYFGPSLFVYQDPEPLTLTL